MHTPQLDLGDFLDGDENQRAQFARAIIESLTMSGFARIVGHGMGEKQVQDAFDFAHKFFSMSPEQKDMVKNESGPTPQRGWSCPGAESTASLFKAFSGIDGDASNLKDAREHWDQGPETDFEFPNKWPAYDALPGFRECMTGVMNQMSQVSDLLMEAIELGLGLAPGTVLSNVGKDKGASEFRLNHYPCLSNKALEKGDLSRIWPHFDLGVITLLFQDDVGGLEFEDRQRPGEFRQVVPSEPTEMIVNVSETLQRWTNDRLPAGLHRVTPPRGRVGKDGVVPERFSIAYFCKANRDASVAPLEHFVREEGKAKYTEMTAMEYHQHRLQSAY